MQRSKVIQWAETNFISADQLYDDPNARLVLQVKNAISAYVYLTTWFLSDYNKLKDTAI